MKFGARLFLEYSLKTININRAHALLVYDGLKPGCLFPYFEEKEKLEEKFERYGIIGKVVEYPRTNVAFISNHHLEGLVDAFERTLNSEKGSNKFKSANYELGRLLGYPETAIKAYLSQFEKGKYLKQLKKKERTVLRKLMCYVSDEEHYESDRLIAVEWEKHILKRYPLLYLRLNFENKIKKLRKFF